MHITQVITELHIPRNYGFSFLIIVYIQGIDFESVFKSHQVQMVPAALHIAVKKSN